MTLTELTLLQEQARDWLLSDALAESPKVPALKTISLPDLPTQEAIARSLETFRNALIASKLLEAQEPFAALNERIAAMFAETSRIWQANLSATQLQAATSLERLRQAMQPIQLTDIATVLAQIQSGSARVAKPAVRPAKQSLQATFRQRRDEWLAATRSMSSITKETSHRTYVRVIALGEAVIPLLIGDLQKHPKRNWHTALCILTGINPIGPEDAGNTVAIAAAWKRYLEERNREPR